MGKGGWGETEEEEEQSPKRYVVSDTCHAGQSQGPGARVRVRGPEARIRALWPGLGPGGPSQGPGT